MALSSESKIQVEPGKPGAEVSKGKQAIRQRKNLPIECEQHDRPARRPNRRFCGHQPSAVPSGGGWLCFRGVSAVMQKNHVM